MRLFHNALQLAQTAQE
jgi:hypothetical protein